MCLAGISPNNDEHIMRLILENKDINKVIFTIILMKIKKSWKIDMEQRE